MNERIFDIAKQADAFYIPRYDMWQMDTETLKNYTELIVRECIEQVFVSIPDTMCSASGAYKTARLAAISSIKEHFGVE